MAIKIRRPISAKLKIAKTDINPVYDIAVDNGELEQKKKIFLNVDGRIAPAATDRTIVVHIRIFYRCTRAPFHATVIEQEVVVPSNKEKFSFDFDKLPAFVPRHTTVHSIRVLTWDKKYPPTQSKFRERLRTDVVRLRVK